MRILLTANASYVPPRGGSTRSNLVWLEYLASRGYDCRVVAPALAEDTPEKAERVRTDIEDQEIQVTRVKRDHKLGFDVLDRGGITVYSVADASRLREVLRQKILKYRPDWVLVSTEDLGQALLATASEAAPGRVIYLAHTPQMFPFGPASLNPNPKGTELVKNCAAIVAIGRHTAEYIEEHTGRRPVVIHPPVYGKPPWDVRDPDKEGLITIINPSAVKGISIFLALARRFPQYNFGALRGWSTTAEDMEAMQALPNITMLRKVKHIEAILRRTKILLMPALWYEGFGLVVMEAMLRGVPVLASNMGSLVEAKAGTNYVLPVRPIERYSTVFDENRMPKPVAPEQDVEPWARAVRELMEDRELYRRESAAAREAAMRFVPKVEGSQFENFLLKLEPAADAEPPQQPAAEPAAAPALEGLSAAKRALLLKRLKERTGKG